MSTILEVNVASGDALDVREFVVHQAISSLFSITLTAVSRNADVDFEAVIGLQASFTVHGRSVDGAPRTWTGICNEMHQVRSEEKGLTTYHLRIVPKMWLASQRRSTVCAAVASGKTPRCRGRMCHLSLPNKTDAPPAFPEHAS